MQTPMRGACSLVIAILFLSSRQAARAEDSDAIGARLQRVDAATALDASGVAPWHMKMSVQLLDAQGQPTEQGLIEEWWSGPTRDRVVYALPSYKATELQTEAGFFRTKGAEQPPLMLELLREQVVHPMPAARELEGAKPEVRKEKFGKAPLDASCWTVRSRRLRSFPLAFSRRIAWTRAKSRCGLRTTTARR
jgi:hypothetical protein